MVSQAYQSVFAFGAERAACAEMIPRAPAPVWRHFPPTGAMNCDSIDYRAFVHSLGPQLAAHQSHAAVAAGRPMSARTPHPRQQLHGGVDEAPNSLGAPYIEPTPNPLPREGRRNFGRHTPGMYTGLTDQAAVAAVPLAKHELFACAAGLDANKIAAQRHHMQPRPPTNRFKMDAPPATGLAGRHTPHGEVELPGEGGTGRRHITRGYEHWASAQVGVGMQDPARGADHAPGTAARPRPPQLPHMRASVDEVIFSRDLDGSSAAQPFTSSAAFEGAAGVDTTRLACITARGRESREPQQADWLRPPPPHQRTQVDQVVHGRDRDGTSTEMRRLAQPSNQEGQRAEPRVMHLSQPAPRATDAAPTVQHLHSHQVRQESHQSRSLAHAPHGMAGHPTVGRSGLVSHFASQMDWLG
jgi:hypothetical protein